MKKILAAVVAVPLVLGLGLVAYASTKPDTFKVERHLEMKAPASKVAPLLTDFHQWAGWSPWEKLDPNLKRTYSGPASGKGAVYEWEGNDQVGKGRMEILDATADQVTIKLDFIKPFESTSTTTFDLASKGDATNVNWKMSGPSPLVSKIFSCFCDMDKMIGKDFEAGLSSMKALAEK
jgi:hypothetical protein